MAVDPAWIALAGTLCGGVGLKLAEHWLGRSKVKVDDAARMRDELRLEITAQREEIKKLEADVEKWREANYALRDKYMELQTQYTILLERIKKYVGDVGPPPAELPPTPPKDS